MEEKYLKLTKAVYDSIEFLPEKEPLKNKIKETSLSVLGNLIFLSLSTYGNPVSFFSDNKESKEKKNQILVKTLSDISVLKNYLKIGKSQGWIDSFNFLILSKEYDIIRERLEKDLQKKEEKIEKKEIKEESFSDRQEKILDFLKEKEKAQVSNLKEVFPQVSKRTLRRDLDDLMKKEKIKREGEWNQVFYKIKTS